MILFALYDVIYYKISRSNNVKGKQKERRFSAYPSITNSEMAEVDIESLHVFT